MINRRDLLLGGAAGAAALGFGRVDPDFLMNSAFAAEGRTLRFLGAEALTGNWDPTTHTNLGQIIAEGFVFGYLTRAPMKPEKPDELVFELPEGDVTAASAVIERVMAEAAEPAVKLDVPLGVEIGTGASWGAAH